MIEKTEATGMLFLTQPCTRATLLFVTQETQPRCKHIFHTNSLHSSSTSYAPEISLVTNSDSQLYLIHAIANIPIIAKNVNCQFLSSIVWLLKRIIDLWVIKLERLIQQVERPS